MILSLLEAKRWRNWRGNSSGRAPYAVQPDARTNGKTRRVASKSSAPVERRINWTSIFRQRLACLHAPSFWRRDLFR